MKRAGKGIGVLGLLLLLFPVALWLYPRNEAGHNALAARALATQVLAEHLAHKYPGQRVLVIGNPFTLTQGRQPEAYAFEEAGLRGLRKGFGDAGKIMSVVFPELRQEYLQDPASVFVDPASTTPLSYLVAEDALDRLIREHPECALVVSLIGLPANLAGAEFWGRTNAPKFALLLPDWRIVGDGPVVQSAWKSGKIVAAVLNKPGSPAEQSAVEKESQTAFDRRFLLVTAENFDEVQRAFPRLF